MEQRSKTCLPDASTSQLNFDWESKILFKVWTPPTPPREGQNEVYEDPTVGYLYETTPMAASRLPPMHLTKPHQTGKRTVYKSIVYFRDQLQGAAK